MGTARQDFERFVRWLHQPERQAPESARRLANLVLTRFDAVAETARQRNSRSNLLATLARRDLAATTADLPQLPDAAPQGRWPWARLRQLTLGPFRGFRNQQVFDLSARVVLCYGPNGSGKSSVCEALEYALCGSVEEAGSRRIDQRDYLANIHEERFTDPVLLATDNEDREVRVVADGDAFRFFFVEKNRIDNFSRIAATPPGRKTDLIASLFGMDQFNDFCAHFNESMDAALTLSPTLQTQLASKRQALRTDEETRDGEAESLRALDQLAANFAGELAPELTYDGLRGLVGSPEMPGRLQQLDARLRGLPPALTDISREKLASQIDNVSARAEMVTTSQRRLDEMRSQVSFRNLFAAVQSLRQEHPDQCPACLTPIHQVSSNPFERAQDGLVRLQELAGLEADHAQVQRVCEEASRELRAELSALEEFMISEAQVENSVCAYLSALPQNPDGPAWWAPLLVPETDPTGATPSLDQLLEVADRAGGRDSATREAIQARQADLAEQGRLNDARVWMAEHDIRRAGVVDAAAQARARIAQWDAAKADLIRGAREEALANERDRPIKEPMTASTDYWIASEHISRAC